MEQQPYQAVRSAPEAVGLLLSEDEGPGEDVTGGVLQGVTKASDPAESPCLHAFWSAMRCASAIGRERMREWLGRRSPNERVQM